MRKIQFLFIMMLCALGMQGANVECTAGGLSEKVTNHSITDLTITGTMDARDFMFISNELNELKQVNLSQVTIVAYDGIRTPLVNGQILFPANELPQLSFFGKKLTSVVLPTSLKSIGMAAFAGCKQLKSITFPSKLASIGSYAFNGSGLETVNTPAAIKTIGKGAFSRCEQLTSVKTNPNVIEAYAFLGCTNLTEVIIDNSIQHLGVSAFNGCSSLSRIQFRNCARLSLIDAEAFVKSGLQTIDMKSMKALTEIGDYAFLGLKDIEEVTIPANVSYIGTRAMMGMSKLRKLVSKPTDVPALGDSVWAGIIPSKVELLVNNVDDYRAADQWKDFTIYKALIVGDVNGDGNVNVTDVTTLVNMILGVIPKDMLRGDLNGDGKINVTDVTRLVNIILSGTETVIHEAPEVTTDDFVSIDNFSIAPDEVKSVEIKLNNEIDYASMQFDVVLPAGLTVVGNSLDVTSRLAGHNIMSKDNGEAYRIVAYSLNNDVFNGNEGAVLRLKLRASSELATDAHITINNVVYSTEMSKTFFGPSTTTQVSNATGVDDLLAAHDKVYASGGMLVIETAEAGIAQLVQMNGMVQDLQVAEGRNEFGVTSGFVIVRLNGKSYKLAVK